MSTRLTIETTTTAVPWPAPAPQPPTVTLTSQCGALKPAGPPGSACGYQVVVLDGDHLADGQAVVFDEYFTIPNERWWVTTYSQTYDAIAAALGPYNEARYCAAVASFGLDTNMYPSLKAQQALGGFGAGPGLNTWLQNCDPGSEDDSGTWTTGGAYVMVGFGASTPGDAVEAFTLPWQGTEPLSVDVFFYPVTSGES
ncbi:MAG TPA: hypothetical protein VGX28_11795 [Frankiaceae bacterium]|jgi:hypothetical protein|nr:hypothetical protein [Frankiaceae bacterium]